MYWHLDTFPTRASAEASKGSRGVVVDSLKRHWLFTIAEQDWGPSSGERIAMIGPLVVDRDVPYTARYMETVIPAGFQPPGGPGHRHPGPEAWYVVEGGQCLETPNGVFIARAGQTMLAPEGWPMAIASLSPETRRAVVLVLHRSKEPYVMPVDSPSRRTACTLDIERTLPKVATTGRSFRRGSMQLTSVCEASRSVQRSSGRC